MYVSNKKEEAEKKERRNMKVGQGVEKNKLSQIPRTMSDKKCSKREKTKIVKKVKSIKEKRE